MAKIVQQYRLASAPLAEEVGALGQIIINLSNFAVHVMDGFTPGGHAQALASLENVQDASTDRDGKMTKEMVAELQTATANISILASSIAATDDDVAALDAAKVTKVAGTLNNLVLFSASGAIKDAGIPFFAVDCTLTFASALPTFWTLVTAFNDCLAILTNNAGLVAQTGGAWVISGASTNVSIDTSGMSISHSLSVTVPNEGVDDNAGSGVFVGRDGTYTVNGSISLDGSASGSGSTTFDGNWRPPFVRTIFGKRDAIPA